MMYGNKAPSVLRWILKSIILEKDREVIHGVLPMLSTNNPQKKTD